MNEDTSAGTDLQQLLSQMSPEMQRGTYVFLSFPHATYGDQSELDPLAAFHEKEGLTLVVTKEAAEKYGHNYDMAFRCITLQVHSSLEAVGLTAAFSRQLTQAGISANVMAGFYHDHILVPVSDADKAMLALRELSESG